jgi:Protein of unknown function (DUF 659)/hAT family C-terminal dimerisation region
LLLSGNFACFDLYLQYLSGERFLSVSRISSPPLVQMVAGRPQALDVQREYILHKKCEPPLTLTVLFFLASIDLKDTWKCRSCPKTYAYNPSRMRTHLTKCAVYLKRCKAKSINNQFTRQAANQATNQSTIPFPTISPSQKDILDRRFALACYSQGLPFTVFESPEMKEALHELHPAYKPPTRYVLSGKLLEEVYSDLKVNVDKAITATPYLNVITDESENISSERIANISIHTLSGAFHWTSEDLLARRMTAVGVSEWLKEHLKIISNGDLSRINSIATDTCNTMLGAWEKLHNSAELKHCFFIPCDSHGIQLLIKDLFTYVLSLKELHDQAQAIVKAFRKATLQYARLRGYQIQRYGKKQSLCLSVITRWGTQYRLINSVLKNKAALQDYAIDHGPENLKYGAHEIILSSQFWTRLGPLHEVFEPLNTAIKMSESDKSNLGHIIDRWAGILKTLTRGQLDFPDLKEFLEDPIKPKHTFLARFTRQVLPIHTAAFYLNPLNCSHPMTAENQTKVFEFFKQYSDSAEDAKTLRIEFLQYQNGIFPFEQGRACWEHTDDPRIFWLMQMHSTQLLGKFAARIYSTPANSVPSESAFSTQNYILTKTRNRLESTRVDKLTYIYINGRILRRIKGDILSQSLYDLSEEEEVALEDAIMEDEEMLSDNEEETNEVEDDV